MLDAALSLTLRTVGEVMQVARDPWWVIASAAVALHGVELDDVGDVDVLLSTRDAAQVVASLGIAANPTASHAQFQSDQFATWTVPPLPVEFMAGFRYRTEDGWQPVLPKTRERFDVDGVDVFVPGRQELCALLHGFGRPKDLVRAALMAALT